jgi:hypothetical protein
MPGKMQHLWTVGLAVCAVGLIGTTRLHAQILPGNFWPNPTLETPDPADNTRPEGWQRGGGDFGSPGPFQFDFWDTSASVSPTHSLLVEDSATNNNGEWFFENAVPLPVGGGPDVLIRMNRQWNVVGSPGEMRLSIVWHDGIGFFADTHFVVQGSQATFLEETFQRPIPAIATGMRIVIASGGGGDVTGFIRVDDISVARVPEPATAMTLLGAAGLLVGRRRRR